MAIREITDKNVWENFLAKCEEKTFLQSWNWGEFQKLQGNKIWRLGVYDNNGNPISIILVVKIEAKRGTFLLVQHCAEISEVLLNELKKIGREEMCDFIRMAPLVIRKEENEKLFKKMGFKEAAMHANAYEATWKLDITPTEEDLLKNMRKTTRYLIKQAKNNPDIVIERSENLSDVETYQKLNKEVGKRQKFVPFSDEYIKNEFDIFEDGQVMWFFGRYKGEVAASALIIFWSGIGFYHQAASLSKFAKLSIPYLLQWEAIKEAKKRGCKLYDFWGFTDPLKYPEHPWAGPTLFKMGFGGRAHEYIKTQDYPLSKKYWLINIFEKLRKFKRGL